MHKSFVTNKFNKCKNKSKQQGLEFNLTREDFSIDKAICPVFNTEIKWKSTPDINAISIDRVDSSKGYTKDNIQYMSKLANTMKNSASIEELLSFKNWINTQYKHKGELKDDQEWF